ncbi:TetR/AcrR family transcriptional regulator [Ilumatobacter nonamiensis]|uniref:TetR/AcrR family transcriptional regulator n=1 Tax=Ilumatobacter nonamiensis TaxID=467093 RepID=UPI00034CECB8|nr:TetR/AcrR family transcriptional regulator [Ilumatobacter nonamiensis]
MNPRAANTQQPSADGDSTRTRGGWIPVGTAAERRTKHAEHGTDRGRKTRNGIIDAARRVFERMGYLDATVDDIVSEAEVARGSYYTYFPDKLAVFRVVSEAVGKEILAAVSGMPQPAGTTTERLAQSNRQYVEAYREHAAIYGLTEQLATIDPVIHDARLARRQQHAHRVSASIRRWQSAGRADPEIDVDATAAMLVSMTSNFCYWWFVGGEDWETERAVETLTSNWIRVLGLRDRPRKAWREAYAARL